MYSLGGYGKMIANGRTEAYAQALRRTVKPGSVVVDLGTGAGIMALLACRAGARKVYAIETSDVIAVAREIAVANGCGDRIEFIQDVSTQVALPERADVIVSDLRDLLPLFGHHLPSIIDARLRFLKLEGTLIPQRDTLWAALVTAPELYRRHVEPWERNSYGLDMLAARGIEINTWSKCRVRADQFACPPQCWTVLDYPVVDRTDADGSLELIAARAATAHGFVVWFDSILATGVSMINAPGSPELMYAQAFFPWSQSVPLVPGDMVSVRIQATLVGADYVWRWDSRIVADGGDGPLKAEFRQCTFFGELLSPTKLLKRSAGYVPALNDAGRLDQLILKLLDAYLPLGEIADEVLAKFPARFTTWQEALAYVGDLSAKYSQ